METCDFLVVGAGIAGASAGCELARLGRVVVLEQEAMPGYHATGRSAALFTEIYGNAVIRRLARASRGFLEAPPAGFADHPLLAPRGMMTVAPAGQEPTIRAAVAEANRLSPEVREIAPREALARVPVLRPDWVAAALYDPGSRDLDVHALHQGFLRGLKARGGVLRTDAEVGSLRREGGAWSADSRVGRFAAAVVVDAAGAWADAVAERAGLAPLGLVPRRRTVLTIDPPAGLPVERWPLVVDAAETRYFKPDARRILASPVDATPSPPCDARPEELDIATAVARLEQATTLRVARIGRSWAGLRTFAADKTPVVGFDETAPGFFWLAGQGGYGIKTAPALARAAAGLIERGALPDDLAGLGLAAEDLAPARLRRAAAAAQP